MHEHDQDLIAALAEGTLPPHEAAVARPEVLACGSCRRELELQQRALAALRTAPRPTLTELERARLRRAVLPDTREAAAPSPPRWIARWMPAFAAAAVLVVAVGAVALLREAGGGEFEAALESTATSEAPAAGAAEEAPPATIETAAVPEAAADTNGAPYRATAGSVEVVDLGTVTLEEIEERAADLADSFFSSFDDAPKVTRLQVGVSCRDAILEDFSDQVEAVVVAIATVEGSPVEVVAFTDPELPGPLILVVQQDGCSVTATFGP